VLAGIVLSLLAAIPCLGWAGAPALTVPVYGALVAQYAGRILGKPKPKHEPPATPYRR
jgi:hypothetical protein